MLELYRIPYVHTKHSNACFDTEVAEVEPLPADMRAKRVIAEVRPLTALAVLPADCKIEFEHRQALGSSDYGFGTEEEVRTLPQENEVA
jgi:hypothetical protein